MKTLPEILNEITACEKQILALRAEYNELNQINMQSEVGHNILAEINSTNGKIRGLLWTVK